MGTSRIEWTETTWNPVTGCTKISPGCKHCYAERMAKRLAGRFGYPQDEPFRVTIHKDKFDEPLRWKKPRMVFVCSMGDWCHAEIADEVRDEILARAWFAPQHTYQFLTKRVDELADYLGRGCPEGVLDCIAVMADPKATGSGDVEAEHAADYWPWPNVWLGVTAEDQQRADERIPILLQIPAAVRFVSCEPLLTLIEYEWGPEGAETCGRGDEHRAGTCDCAPGVDWVIVGGETGPGARPMQPGWIQSIRDQCVSAGVPFFFKSWGGKRRADRGKKRAGRLLDGREWNEMPKPKGA